jgi:hypothetical protein
MSCHYLGVYGVMVGVGVISLVRLLITRVRNVSLLSSHKALTGDVALCGVLDSIKSRWIAC